MRAHLRQLEPLLVGQDPLDIEHLFDLMADLMHPYRSSMPRMGGRG